VALAFRRPLSFPQGATDNDLEKIARVCQGLSTLDCSGCPRIGDVGVTHLIPKMVQRKKGEVLMGTPKLRNVYFYGTSVWPCSTPLTASSVPAPVALERTANEPLLAPCAFTSPNDR
jgi:hypothetical protein